jgi:hypothetical protein
MTRTKGTVSPRPFHWQVLLDLQTHQGHPPAPPIHSPFTSKHTSGHSPWLLPMTCTKGTVSPRPSHWQVLLDLQTHQGHPPAPPIHSPFASKDTSGLSPRLLPMTWTKGTVCPRPSHWQVLLDLQTHQGRGRCRG